MTPNQLNRARKTSHRTTLVTVWSHPDAGQKFIIPGSKAESRDAAIVTMIGHIGNRRRMVGVEEYWSSKELKALSEYEG
jgi:hypothetical protein